MKKSLSLLLLLTGVWLMSVHEVTAARQIIFEDHVTLNAVERDFLRNYQDSAGLGMDFTVRGIIGPRDSDGSFRGFRVDFNVDTTNFLTQRDIQNQQMFILKCDRLKCKIRILDYTAQVRKEDPLFGPDYRLQEVKLRISVWTTD